MECGRIVLPAKARCLPVTVSNVRNAHLPAKIIALAAMPRFSGMFIVVVIYVSFYLAMKRCLEPWRSLLPHQPYGFLRSEVFQVTGASKTISASFPGVATALM